MTVKFIIIIFFFKTPIALRIVWCATRGCSSFLTMVTSLRADAVPKIVQNPRAKNSTVCKLYIPVLYVVQ